MTIQHGVFTSEQAAGTRPIASTQTGVIGLAATAPEADAARFPLNQPVLINTRAQLGDLGTTGTAPQSLAAIYAQIVAPVVLVRVEDDADLAVTTANIIGEVDAEGRNTGLLALLDAEMTLGVKPKILGAPGFDANQSVVDALIQRAEDLRGFAYAGISAATREDAAAQRALYDSRRLMLLWPELTRDEVGANVMADAASYALGLRAKIDANQGWNKTLSNVPLNGANGLYRSVGHPEATGYLNNQQITTLVQRNGLRFWGNRTCSSEPLYAFESAARTADFLAESIETGVQWAIDKVYSSKLAEEILEQVNANFRTLKSRGLIVDATAWIDPELNTTERLVNGELWIDYDFSPTPPLESLHLRQTITSRYLAQLLPSGS